MDEFLTLATMSQKNFEAERVNNLVLVSENVIIDPRAQEKKFLDAFYSSSPTRSATHSLRIPRKPKWTKEMSKEQLHAQENVLPNIIHIS